MEAVRMGVIGIGNMGTEHCKTLISDEITELKLAAAADLRPERREWARKNLPKSVRIFESGEELIHSGTCDAVLVAVPHYQHPETAVSALQNGLHVLCEKPIAVTSGQARQMLQAAEASGKTLALMFNQRTNCLYRTVKNFLSSGRGGEIKRVNWIVTDWYRTQRYYDSGSWRATWKGEGGGVLLNQCPHQLDLLIWLCGIPRSVSAFCHAGKWHHIEVEDDVSVYMEFENGATGVFVTSTGDLPGTNRLEIDCEQAKIVCENGTARAWLLPENERTVCFESSNPWYQAKTEEIVLETDGKNEQHPGVMKAFAAHLLREEPLTADAEDGLRALMLSNAIHLSGWTGKTVFIPFEEKLFERLLEQKIAGSVQKTAQDRTYETDHRNTAAIL